MLPLLFFELPVAFLRRNDLVTLAILLLIVKFSVAEEIESDNLIDMFMAVMTAFVSEREADVDGGTGGQCGTKKNLSPERIVGGAEVHPHEYPWQVLAELLYTETLNYYYCGGTLISERWVMTAAHCVHSSKPVFVMAYLGMHAFAETRESYEGPTTNPFKTTACQKIFVKNIIYHEDYNDIHENDIALLELAVSAAFSPEVRSVCLASDTTQYLNQRSTVSGWGYSRFRDGSMQPRLMDVDLLIIPTVACNLTFTTYDAGARFTITDKMFCAYEEGKDSCKGDSGGPLIREVELGYYVQYGIVSFGDECAKQGVPGVYTKVPVFRDWILSNTNDSSICFC